MELYLVQHAEAVPKEKNPDRPLTEQGFASVRKMASFIARNTDIAITSILHSGKTRALQTAEIFGERLHISDRVKPGKELNPQSHPWGWVERLSKMEENIMIVGHLPYLKRLTALLICQDEMKPCVEFENSGVVCLERNESGIWSINWIIVPRVLP